jgi:hypothetical protein
LRQIDCIVGIVPYTMACPKWHKKFKLLYSHHNLLSETVSWEENFSLLFVEMAKKGHCVCAWWVDCEVVFYIFSNLEIAFMYVACEDYITQKWEWGKFEEHKLFTFSESISNVFCWDFLSICNWKCFHQFWVVFDL